MHLSGTHAFAIVLKDKALYCKVVGVRRVALDTELSCMGIERVICKERKMRES